MFPLLPTDLPTSTPSAAAAAVEHDVDKLFFDYFQYIAPVIRPDNTYQSIAFDGLRSNFDPHTSAESTPSADSDEAVEGTAPLIVTGRLTSPATSESSPEADDRSCPTRASDSKLTEPMLTEVLSDHKKTAAKPGPGSTPIPAVPHQTVFAIQVTHWGDRIAQHEQAVNHNILADQTANIVQLSGEDSKKSYGTVRNEAPSPPPIEVSASDKSTKPKSSNLESDVQQMPQNTDTKAISSISNMAVFNSKNIPAQAFQMELESIRETDVRQENVFSLALDKDQLIGGGKLFIPEIIRQIAPQLVPAISRDAGNTTEIALNPVELGKLRMNVTIHDGVVALQIMAERPETADLLRRHIESLAAELHALGFGDVTFSFSEGGSAKTSKDDGSSTTDIEDPKLTIDNPAQPSKRASDGLDLRL